MSQNPRASMNGAIAVLITVLACAWTMAYASDRTDAYPVLAIPRSAGADALLKHTLTADEQKLFAEIDAQTGKLSRTAAMAEYHRIAINVGKRYGLSPAESIAFYIRTTFSEFEPTSAASHRDSP